MGLYIGIDMHHGKAGFLIKQCGAELLDAAPASFEAIPKGKVLVCVVDNGPFEAAAIVVDAEFFAQVMDPTDTRPRNYLMMDRNAAFNAAALTKDEIKKLNYQGGAA